ncbi:MAG: type I DNA topoisomerase [Bacteroidales bacterium]|nr:type I DNA topoisomerase [Bacteroidales bacterium]
MSKNLVIVESPAKAKTIEGILGKDYKVKSCFGHVRDLSKKGLGIDIEDNFNPIYEISDDKKKVVADLTKLSNDAEVVWLASDEDREGEAISWHLSETLHLPEDKTKRIVFSEITKTAILNAIENPRGIDYNLVHAQQARRVLDRLVGFELSPLLWKKVKPALSAGRVQSVVVRLIVEREEAIKNFIPEYAYKVSAIFTQADSKSTAGLKTTLVDKLNTKEEVIDFINTIKDGDFVIDAIETKPATKSPAPPFTTSTLQQEASRKLGLSVTRTMSIAQQLYESGKITYMRTDSVNLSTLALGTIKNEIIKEYGKEYSRPRKYSVKSKGAQEAHEAIRPTYVENVSIEGDTYQQRLYSLIWKRAVASQMSDAKLEYTTITIKSNKTDKIFTAKTEVLLFDGFLKVYNESTDNAETDEEITVLPFKIEKGQHLKLKELNAAEKATKPPYRYSDASLVKKMEELGIGRPSTYAPTIYTIQKRGYVEKINKSGENKEYNLIYFKNNAITESKYKEKEGVSKGKFAPTDMGYVVNKFLVNNFSDIMDYNFTAKIEKGFDEIAKGKLEWQKMLANFYPDFHEEIQNADNNKSDKVRGEKLLGVDPATGKNVYVKLGRYGLMAQIGESEDEEKPRFTGLKKGQTLENVTFEDVMELFKYPKNIGKYEDSDVIIGQGRFGPYIRHNSSFYSIPSSLDPLSMTLENAVEIINNKREQDKNKTIKTFTEDPKMLVLNGRFGPYISFEKKNYKIPKTIKPEEITYSECLTLIEKAKNKAQK